MNDLKMLDELGRTLDPQTATPPGRLRHRVLTEATRPARRGPRIAAPRFGWRLAAAGGLAAALTVGVLATQVVSFPDHAPVSTASAAERVLAGAAEQARRQPTVPVRGDQFIYVESLTASISVHEGSSERATISAAQRRIWLSADGTRDGLLREQGRPGPGGPDGMVLPGCHDGLSTQSKHGKTEEVACTPSRATTPTCPAMPPACWRTSTARLTGRRTPGTRRPSARRAT